MFLNIQVFKGIFRWKFLWATNNISYASLLPSFCNWLSAFRARQTVVHANDPSCINWFENGESQVNINIIKDHPWILLTLNLRQVPRRELVFHKLFCFSINSQIIFRWRWVVRFSARYIHVKSLQITFIDHTWQDAKWSLPGNNLLFMSIHKLYMYMRL